MLINDYLKTVIIAIPKTGSSSIYWTLGGEHLKYPEPFLYHAPLQRIVKMYPETIDYKKCAFVRHPLDKLVSIYHDFKSRDKGYSFLVHFEKPLFHNFPTFRDFCLGLDDSIWSDDIFFIPQFDFVSLNGQLNVDFIGRFENLEQDFVRMCHFIGVQEKPLLHVRPSVHAYYQYYYDKEIEAKMRKRYAIDFETFKYE